MKADPQNDIIKKRNLKVKLNVKAATVLKLKRKCN